ncbi:MAG TPA: SET domain-containing protein [Myxococcota bacterium]|nr:SET domain-containing protein [Myxococcota bacterium]
MLLVKTKLGLSSIDGIGLFADQFIAKGTRVWQWSDGFDIRVKASELERLSPQALETFLRYSFLSKRTGLYVLCFDNARFLNHSVTPNLNDTSADDSEEGLDVAIRDIHPGEELTSDYRDFDGETVQKMANIKECHVREPAGML